MDSNSYRQYSDKHQYELPLVASEEATGQYQMHCVMQQGWPNAVISNQETHE